MNAGAVLHDAMRGPIRPLSARRRATYQTIIWRWTARIGREHVLEVARGVGARHPGADDETLWRELTAALVTYARTRQSRPPEVRAAAKLRRLATRGIPKTSPGSP